MTHQNSKKNKTVKVFVDYWVNGSWGCWYGNRNAGPNTVHSEPTIACKIARDALARQEKTPEFDFSPAVCLLHAVERRTI